MAKKKLEEKPTIVETPLKEGKLETIITKNDLENNPDLEELGLKEDDLIIVEPQDVVVFEQPDLFKKDFVSQDQEDMLLPYINEFLTSLEGIFIGGHAAQKRDQLIEYLNKR
jgi:hypothetical protein